MRRRIPQGLENKTTLVWFSRETDISVKWGRKREIESKGWVERDRDIRHLKGGGSEQEIKGEIHVVG